MRAAQQLGSGLFYALVSVVLVVGGLSLALSEKDIAAPPTGTPSPTAVSQTSTPTQSGPTTTASRTATPQVITSTPTLPLLFPTIYIAPSPVNTAIPCGPFFGWTKSYAVQHGDTLFHIATLYSTTVANLERANCKFNSTIYTGEHLWVPNVPTITPGVTVIPDFGTPTQVPTEPLTLTPLPYTATVIPTDISVPDP